MEDFVTQKLSQASVLVKTLGLCYVINNSVLILAKYVAS